LKKKGGGGEKKKNEKEGRKKKEERKTTCPRWEGGRLISQKLKNLQKGGKQRDLLPTRFWHITKPQEVRSREKQ